MQIAPQPATLITVGSLHTITIEKLVYGGNGLAHIGAQAVFIPFAAIGDQLLVRITSVERNYARGAIEKILKPSPTRRTPPCPHFGVCGGCQLQHLEYAAQLTAKLSFLRESLFRIGAIEWPHEIEMRADKEFGYRARAEIQIERRKDGRPHVGYFLAGTHEVCEIESCPILLPSANRELQQLRAKRSYIPSDATRVYLIAGDDETIVTPATGDNARAAEIDALGTAHQRIAGMNYAFGIKSFFQGNRLLVEELIQSALGDARGKIAVDLYAGVGLFTLQLAQRFERVHAIEGNRLAASHGVENVRANGLNNIIYETTSVEAWLKYKAKAVGRPDFVLLDPPRVGAGQQVIERLIALAPPVITYVSCDPATLARDLKQLINCGYQLTSIVALDMFPQTFHLEAVAHLKASK